jgi:site-specific DNA-methyltransferase (cytosine-N4-specific)
MLQNLEPYPVKASNTGRIPDGSGLKPKDLMGIPWRVAFALQADGWWLRSDIIFAKKAPMPESVTDRPTRSHEYVFLLTKSAQYYYDADAIREPNAEASSGWARQRVNGTNTQVYSGAKWSDDRNDADKPQRYNDSGATGRNKRDVWLLGPEPLSDAHFAVMPTKLVEPCILAGSAPGDTVLDPFAGSGTVLVVAKRLNRAAIGIELNETYVSLIHKRLDAVTLPLPLHTAQEQTA